MAIARRPSSNRSVDPEKAADTFIRRADQPIAPSEEPAPATSRKTPIMLRFDPSLLKRVDKAAARRGISRTAWIAYTVSEALDADNRND
ncbi:MAG: hypothetical protein ACJ8AI_13890 [Rhodopila sp.]